MSGFIHDSKLQPNHSTTATFESSTSQKLTREIVFKAMQKVIVEHPRLSVSYIRALEKSGHERRAVRLNQVDLRECISFVDDPETQVNDVLENDEFQWFERKNQLPEWRLAVLNGKHVIFLFNHLCCDGLSTMAFYRSFASALNTSNSEASQCSDLSNIAIVKIPEMPLVESPFAKFERDTAMIFMLGNATKEVVRTAFVSVIYPSRRQILRDFHHPKYQRKCGDEVMRGDTQDPYSPRYKKITIEKTMMAKLTTLCKENKATFTSLLHTLIIGIQSSFVSPEAKFARSRIAVSYRRYTGTPESVMTDEVGNVYWGKRLTTLRGLFLIKDTDRMWEAVWNESRKYKNYVKDDLNNEKKHAKINGHAKFMGQTDEKITHTMGLLGRQRHRTIEISNLGVFSPITDTKGQSKRRDGEIWRITGYSFNSAPSHRSFGASIAFGVVSMEGGDCEINMGYDGCAIDDHLMEYFARLLKEKLRDCSETYSRHEESTSR